MRIARIPERASSGFLLTPPHRIKNVMPWMVGTTFKRLGVEKTPGNRNIPTNHGTCILWCWCINSFADLEKRVGVGREVADFVIRQRKVGEGVRWDIGGHNGPC